MRARFIPAFALVLISVASPATRAQERIDDDFRVVHVEGDRWNISGLGTEKCTTPVTAYVIDDDPLPSDPLAEEGRTIGTVDGGTSSIDFMSPATNLYAGYRCNEGGIPSINVVSQGWRQTQAPSNAPLPRTDGESEPTDASTPLSATGILLGGILALILLVAAGLMRSSRRRTPRFAHMVCLTHHQAASERLSADRVSGEQALSDLDRALADASILFDETLDKQTRADLLIETYAGRIQ